MDYMKKMTSVINHLYGIATLTLLAALVMIFSCGSPEGAGAGAGESGAKALTAAGQEVTDTGITHALTGELIDDEAVSARGIDVETEEGVVTLSGVVDNLLARERAVSIARRIKGVRSVVDRLEVEPVVRSDETIRRQVEARLSESPVTESFEIETAVSEAVVTLTGEVDSWPEKELAGNVAARVSGVRDVRNRIDLSYRTERPDSEIAADIRGRLRNDVRVDESVVAVDVEDGMVTLTGTVGSARERMLAYRLAHVAGVEEVDYLDLEVDWLAGGGMKRQRQVLDITDEDVRDAVKDALLYDPRVESYEPQVEVEGGVVNLTGTVDNLQARRAAGEDAGNTVGVWRVRNLIRVRPSGEPVDNEILTSRVEDYIAGNPMTDEAEITVVALNGEVILQGRVDNMNEKDTAARVASYVPGVVSVENRLQVEDRRSGKTDYAIEQDTENKLFWSPYIAESGVEVEAEDGVVTLRGTVENLRTRWLAAEKAREAGARDVRNRLLVRQGPEELRSGAG